MRTFETGATRDGETGKLDFEGFLSPSVLQRYAEYMHSKRNLPDGSLRDSDNWQLGIPIATYMKSMWRHFFAVWKSYREDRPQEDELCALLFNTMGMLHELGKVPAVAPVADAVTPIRKYCVSCAGVPDFQNPFTNWYWCRRCCDSYDWDTSKFYVLETLGGKQ